jgi:hypothetical protein
MVDLPFFLRRNVLPTIGSHFTPPASQPFANYKPTRAEWLSRCLRNAAVPIVAMQAFLLQSFVSIAVPLIAILQPMLAQS